MPLGCAAATTTPKTTNTPMTAELIPLSLHLLSLLLNHRLSVVVLVFDLCGDLLEELRLEYSQQLPCDVERSKDITVLIRTLGQKLLFEFLCELKVLMLVLAKCLLSYNRLHRACVLPNCVVGVQLIGDV